MRIWASKALAQFLFADKPTDSSSEKPEVFVYIHLPQCGDGPALQQIQLATSVSTLDIYWMFHCGLQC